MKAYLLSFLEDNLEFKAEVSFIDYWTGAQMEITVLVFVCPTDTVETQVPSMADVHAEAAGESSGGVTQRFAETIQSFLETSHSSFDTKKRA